MMGDSVQAETRHPASLAEACTTEGPEYDAATDHAISPVSLHRVLGNKAVSSKIAQQHGFLHLLQAF